MTLPYQSPVILSQWRPSIMIRWDVATLSYVYWDGSLTTGALTIGTVNQGTPGSSATPWYTSSGFSLVGYDYVSYTSGATTDTYVFKTGGAGGTTIGTITISYTGADKLTPTTFIKT